MTSPAGPAPTDGHVRASARARKGCKRRGWPLERRRPGLVTFVLDRLSEAYGTPTRQPCSDATSELVLTILSQHTSDVNAERAFKELRGRFHTWQEIEDAPVEGVAAAIVSGGLALQKAPRIQAALRYIRDRRGDHSLEFLASMPPLLARDWLTEIPGVGPKTASVVLLFCFGMPLMPVDTHVERVSRRIGLIAAGTSVVEAHERFLEFIPQERMLEAHVGLITHGRRTCYARAPACGRCPVAERCRYFDPKAP